MKLTDLALSDGHVGGTRSSSTEFVVEFTDWQGKNWEIVFENMIGLESFSAEGEELDKISESVDDIFVARSRKATGEFDAPMICYSFHSPWRDDALLTIVASSCFVRRLGS